MTSILAINLDHLLRFRGVESARIEFKASWDEATVGPQIIRTLCAFANDFENLNGGYIVLGVGQNEGSSVRLPPDGLTEEKYEAAKKWIRGRCHTIDPIYQPVMAPELVAGRLVLVVWAPGSDVRPHHAAESPAKGAPRHYYIRLGSETIAADRYPDLRTQLMQMTARVPFDDRRALNAQLWDIRETKVREFLHNIQSGLLDDPDARAVYRNMRISSSVNAHDVPRNVGLLFFSDKPETWFPGARIEVVQFFGDGTVIEEKTFSHRPIHEQLSDCLGYLETLSIRGIQKVPGQMRSVHWVGYPVQALKEALVNAVYHRSYEGEPEPTKVYLHADRMEIISYPGPVPGIEIGHLEGLAPLPPVPARNRRIGEFLKELGLAEGRGTGIPKLRRAMQDNGSPPARFDFDVTRSYFRVTLPAHPEFQAVLILEEVGRLKVLGESTLARRRLRDAHLERPGTVSLAIAYVRDLIEVGDLPAAEQVYERFTQANAAVNPASLIFLIANANLDLNRRDEATRWLNRLRPFEAAADAIDAAILEKRAGRFEKSHQYFEAAGEIVQGDVKALHEFAQVKLKLAERARPRRDNGHWATFRRLTDEARIMLERVVQMEVPPVRHGWAWFDLGRLLRWRKALQADIRHAFERAVACNPDEPRFQEVLARLREKPSEDPADLGR